MPAAVLLAALLAADTPPDAPDRRCPLPSADPCVYDVKTEFGAVGDGLADDTAALQAALDAACGDDSERSGIVYLPAGTYRLTGTLVANVGRKGSGVGPWLWGESRDSVLLKLDDGAGRGPDGIGGTDDDLTSVLRTHPNDSGKTSANWFMRNLRRFTLDCGDNPGVDGIRYFASNLGVIRDVTVNGNGPVGINSGFLSEAGPDLIQNVTVEGFDLGVKSYWRYGQTLCDLTCVDCATGVTVSANAVGIENLVVRGGDRALEVVHPNHWVWWGGAAAVLGGKFETNRAPVYTTSPLYARDLRRDRGRFHTGPVILSETPAGNAPEKGDRVAEYYSHPPAILGGARNGEPSADPAADLYADRLPIETEPAVEWEPDFSKWLCANDHGADVSGGDDTAALRAAFDAAAETGCTVVTLRGVPRKGGRNWYNLTGDVTVKAPVRQVLGLGFARVLGRGRFVVNGDSAPLVRFQNLNSFGGPKPGFAVEAADRTLICDSCGGLYTGAAGKMFLTNCPGHVGIGPGVRCWARHLNPEGDSDKEGNPPGGLVANRGGRLWALGVKAEGKGTRFLVSDGGVTEVYGFYAYTNFSGAGRDPRPIFVAESGGRLFAAGVKEVTFDQSGYGVKARGPDGAELNKATLGGRPWFHFGTAGE